MTVKDFVSSLKYETDVELNENDLFLCNTNSHSKILDIYGECEIIDWFVTKQVIGTKTYIVINIKGEREE